MILGFYDHDYEWPSEKNLDDNTLSTDNKIVDKNQIPFGQISGKQQQPVPIRHHKQYYTNGSVCDLTGEMRRTEVRVSL